MCCCESRPTVPDSAALTAQQAIDVVYEMSELLNTGLDRQTLSILVALTENGVNPEALANVVEQLQNESRRVYTKNIV